MLSLQAGERILKIVQYLAKLWARVYYRVSCRCRIICCMYMQFFAMSNFVIAFIKPILCLWPVKLLNQTMHAHLIWFCCAVALLRTAAIYLAAYFSYFPIPLCWIKMCIYKEFSHHNNVVDRGVLQAMEGTCGKSWTLQWSNIHYLATSGRRVRIVKKIKRNKKERTHL